MRQGLSWPKVTAASTEELEQQNVLKSQQGAGNCLEDKVTPETFTQRGGRMLARPVDTATDANHPTLYEDTRTPPSFLLCGINTGLF